MKHRDEQAVDAMMRRVGLELARHDDGIRSQSEAFLRWLADDLRAGSSGAERAADRRQANAFASRVRRAHLLRRAGLRLPRRALVVRTPGAVVPASQAVVMARAASCAPLLELSAAAGSGREFWDEPCEAWLELTPDLPKGAFVALGVSGDSMAPVLDRHDVILVHLDARPAIDDIVVVRLPGDGYVVKRLAAVHPERMELASFNEGYAPIVVRRDESVILGVVIARVMRST